MANLEPPGAPRTGRDVWTLPGLPGYLDSVQAAGAVAAPLLAGASFTLAALVLQASSPFARWPDLALFCFVGAGLAQVFAVQCVVWTRRYVMTPDEARQWFPDDFEHHEERPTPWLAKVQWGYVQRAQTWARRTVIWVNAGISLLLAGVAASVIPDGHIDPVRWAVIVIACGGVLVEASWVTVTRVREGLRRELMSALTTTAISGAALAAATLAGLSVSPGFPVAAWWAIGLAVAAASIWLSAQWGLRLRDGRPCCTRPSAGRLALARRVVTLIPPTTFAAAMASVRRVLSDERKARLRELHPGVQSLLPGHIALSEHHRALSHCSAVPAADGVLGRLLAESYPVLGDRQPTPQALADRVRRVPGCVVTVVDRHDRTRFGYFIVYPLRAEAVHRIMARQITSGSQLKPDDLAAPAETVNGAYVSVIWAPGAAWTRRCVIASLVESLAAIRTPGIARPLFARPANDAGRALMEEYGFSPVSAKDAIWVRY